MEKVNSSKTNRYSQMLFIVGFMTLINLLFLNQSFAMNVIYESPMTFALKDGRIWTARIHAFEGTKMLEIYTDIAQAKNKKILSADISECSFCSGDEDNCAEDGIDIIEVPRHSRPIINAVCHVGVHSQQLLIFDPKQNQNEPVLKRTGAYSLRLWQQGEQLYFSYDQYVEGSTCPDTTENISGYCTVTENWP